MKSENTPEQLPMISTSTAYTCVTLLTTCLGRKNKHFLTLSTVNVCYMH